jgi:putative phage-type endonuclease
MFERIELELEQGSESWLQHRLTHDNASELAIAMNISPYASRNDLIRARKSGNGLEYSQFVKDVIFPNGHRVEALIRALVEKRLDEDFIPKVFAYGSQSASLDGLNIFGTFSLEIKQFNKALWESVSNGILPDYHKPQVQQGLMCSGAEVCFFAVGNEDATDFVYIDVLPDPEFIANIPKLWEKFHEAEADFVDVETVRFIEEGESRENLLPVVTFQGGGIALTSNIKNWFAIRETKYEAITKKTITAENAGDFKAIADEFENGEGLIDEVLKRITTEATPVIDLIAELKSIKKYLAAGRIYCNKTVTDFRREIRQKACDDALVEFNAYVDELGAKLADYDISLVFNLPDFMGKCSRTKNHDSLSSAIGAEMDRAKIEADNLYAELLEKAAWFNEYKFTEDFKDLGFLFDSLQSIIYKPKEDFELLVKSKISEYFAEEKAKADAKQKAEDEKNERIAINKRLLTETELAKSMLNPVDVSFNVDQVRTESARLFGLIKEGMNAVEADGYECYSIKLSILADKMNADAEIAGALLAAVQSEAGQVDPDDAIRAEIKDLRERASHIYQSAQYCDNGTTRRAEESQAQSLNIKASKLEKELDIQIRIKANIELAASWLDESVDILALDAKEVMAESERLFDLITENTSFAEVNSYSAHSKQLMNLADEIIAVKPISASKEAIIEKLSDDEFDGDDNTLVEIVITGQADVTYEGIPLGAYIPPSKTGWDDPQVAASDPIIADEDVKEERKLGVICPKRLKVISFVRTEFGLNMGAAENWLIKEFGGNIQKPSTGDLF